MRGIGREKENRYLSTGQAIKAIAVAEDAHSARFGAAPVLFVSIKPAPSRAWLACPETPFRHS